MATFAAAVTRAMALAEEAKYAYTLAEEEKLRVNPHSNLPKIIGKRGVGNWEATRKQRGNDAILREARFSTCENVGLVPFLMGSNLAR